MSTWITKNFDIDLWIKLAADHPYKFEQQRDQWLEHSIRDARPEWKARLEGIKWEIRMNLELAKNKFRKCKNLSGRLVQHLIDIRDILNDNFECHFQPRKATVLEFDRHGR